MSYYPSLQLSRVSRKISCSTFMLLTGRPRNIQHQKSQHASDLYKQISEYKCRICRQWTKMLPWEVFWHFCFSLSNIDKSSLQQWRCKRGVDLVEFFAFICKYLSVFLVILACQVANLTAGDVVSVFQATLKPQNIGCWPQRLNR